MTSMNSLALKSEEKVIFSLRALYSKYGYRGCKMNKFEEYDFYAKNKDYLTSENIITFTDTNGKLMALKPDVTLSIIKNSKDRPGYLQKVFYDENVYRVSKNSHTFSEIKQVGLECIGDVDDYSISEVLMLAAESMKLISQNSILEVSQLDILSNIISGLNLTSEEETRMIKAVGEKNSYELDMVCRENDVDVRIAKVLKEIISLYGKPKDVFKKLYSLPEDIVCMDIVKNFEMIISSISDAKLRNMIRIDFSEVNDMKYYNGIAFSGFIDGIPSSVLSGGQYDGLMAKMKKKSKAIGFAVYLDLLERLGENQRAFDVDTVVLYSADEDITVVNKVVESFVKEGETVQARKVKPNKLKYRKLVEIRNGEVKVLEENA